MNLIYNGGFRKHRKTAVEYIAFFRYDNIIF